MNENLSMPVSTPVEETQWGLAAIWRQLLGVSDFRPHDNFFSLGGDSVLALRLVSAASDRWGVDLSFRIIYKWPTLARLAQEIDNLRTANGATHAADDATIVYQGAVYTKLMPAQIYWIDETIDSEYKRSKRNHGAFVMCYSVSGPLDTNSLQRALRYITTRHASLRSTIHRIGETFCLAVADDHSDRYTPQYREFPPPVTTGDLEDFIAYKDHRFDFQQGPLFLSRIARYGEDLYILSIKMHHVIYDEWSINVLLRDLLIAYAAFSRREEPSLSPLKYQLSDYLRFVYRHQQTLFAAHRAHWRSAYPELPPEIEIPGARPQASSLVDKLCAEDRLLFPADLVGRLGQLEKEWGVSRFILLQTTFRMYLWELTGVRDLIIGTSIFGRDYPDAENQIGCYARMVVIGTRFFPQDDFAACLQKVRRASEDMYAYNAFTLMDRLEELVSAGSPVYGTFWKINYQYHDMVGDFIERPDSSTMLEQLNLSIAPRWIGEPDRVVLHIDMIVHFLDFGDKIEVVLEYDSSTYTADNARSFLEGYMGYIPGAII